MEAVASRPLAASTSTAVLPFSSRRHSQKRVQLQLTSHQASSSSLSSSSSFRLRPLPLPSDRPFRPFSKGFICRASAVADAVQVTETLEPNSRVKLSVKVAPKICKQSYDQVLREFSKRVKIPGFQVGKAIPEPILVNFVGKDQIQMAAIEAVLRNTMPQALSSVAGRALKESEHIVTKVDDLKAAFSPTSVLSYDVVVDVMPEVRWITPNAYKNLKVVVEIEHEDSFQKAAEKEMKSRLKDLGSLHVVQDRGVEIGDVLILDVHCNRINDDGSEGDKILSAEQEGFRLDTDEGLSILPGFVDAIVGLKRGDTRIFDLIFPETWSQESLRGVTGRFKVFCKEHFYRILPDLDDSIAEKILEDCSTIDEVKRALLKKHMDEFEQQKLQATQLQIMEELAKVAEIEVPNSLLEEQGRNLYAAKLLELQAKYNFDKDQLVGLSSEQMVSNYLVSQRQKIADSVKQILAVAEIFKLEGLKYSDEELKKEVENAEEEFKRFNQEYDKDRVVEQAKELLEGSKVLEFLMEHSDITYVKTNS